MNEEITPLNSGVGGHPKDRPSYFLSAMVLYLLIVYVYGFWLHPLGRDYILMSGDVAGLPVWSMLLIRIQTTIFGNLYPGYFLFNLVVLYGCMVCIFYLTRFVLGGPWWLGSLSAVLTMAHPLKSESVLQATGALDLIPAFFVLLTLTLFTAAKYHRTYRWIWGAVASFIITVFLTPVCLPLLGVLLLFWWLNYTERTVPVHRWLAVFLLLFLFSFAWWYESWLSWTVSPGQRFGSLILILYPIGLLPETAALFLENPIFGWLSALITIGFILAILLRTQCRELNLTLLAVLVFRLAPLDRSVDWVHMVGGGNLFLSIALAAVAFSALCYRIMQHHKWRRPVVFLTTLLCVVFFVLQIQTIHHWRVAGVWVRSLQHAISDRTKEEAISSSYLMFPDLQYYRKAPYQPAKALQYDTPFSSASPITAILPLHAATFSPIEYRVDTSESGKLRLELYLDAPLSHYLPQVYALESYVLQSTQDYPVSITQYTEGLYEIIIREDERNFPDTRITLPQEWQDELEF